MKNLLSFCKVMFIFISKPMIFRKLPMIKHYKKVIFLVSSEYRPAFPHVMRLPSLVVETWRVQRGKVNQIF